MPVFSDFMHPNRLCKCCHPILHPKHPSVNCSCCVVAWEKTDQSETLESFVSAKESAVIANALIAKPVVKTVEARLDFNAAITNSDHSLDIQKMLFCEEPVEEFPENTSLAEILVKFGIFPSRGQAKKNGWDRTIAPGINSFQIGKLKTQVTVWLPVKFD